MPAYDMRRPEESGRLLQLKPGLDQADPSQIRGKSRTSNPLDTCDASIINALLERLADRVAAAVIARLRGDGDDQDDWLDSRQAADYLGLHRDTLRWLAAGRAIPAEQDGRGCKLFFRRAVLDDWRRSGGRTRRLAALANVA